MIVYPFLNTIDLQGDLSTKVYQSSTSTIWNSTSAALRIRKRPFSGLVLLEGGCRDSDPWNRFERKKKIFCGLPLKATVERGLLRKDLNTFRWLSILVALVVPTVEYKE